MAKFEERLDDSISEVLSEAKLSDELYQKYLQFVGALDALPQDQIATDRFTSDIHDQFGRVRPLSMWPTKSSRAKSERVWLNYNQRMQLQQAAKEGGTAPEDPTDDPDFLGQMLDTCVRTSMTMGGLDKKTAFKHCSRQVQRFEQAVRGAIADRGLPKKEADEFTKELLKGMANGKQIDMKDLSVEDRQFIQDLQDSLTYKPKSESIVKEDLDDQDEFDPKFTEDGVDAYLIEYWGKSALSDILISTAREAAAPGSGFELLDSWGQLDYVKLNFRDVYDEVAAKAIAQLGQL
jgi:hypothetical protein